MKPIHASCSAIAMAAAIAAAPASAAEPLKASVGGYMLGGFGYIEHAGTNQKDVGVLRDGEIHFKVIGSSDNGLTFQARVEIEAFTTGDQIDENFVSVSGSFGRVMIGGNDSAKTHLRTGILFTSPDKLGYYDDEFVQGLTGEVDGGSDFIGIHYFSPNFNGFQMAASYQPSASSDGAGDTNVMSLGAQNIWAVGANYKTMFSGVDVAVSAEYESRELASTVDTYGFGGEFGYSGFTLALYAENNFDDTWDYAAGLAYRTGPWTFVGGYSLTDSKGADDVDTFSGWVSYDLAPGVRTTAGVTYATGGSVPAGTIEDGLIAMSWVTLSF